MSTWQSIEIIPLTRGQSAIIDLADSPVVSGRSWQAQFRSDGKGFCAVSDGLRMSRLLTNPSKDQIVDHINGDGLDNRRANLRLGSQSQNCVNRKTTPGPYLRGARPKKNKWQAYIKYRGHQKSLGYFRTEREAHVAYLDAGRKLHGNWMPLPEGPSDLEVVTTGQLPS